MRLNSDYKETWGDSPAFHARTYADKKHAPAPLGEQLAKRHGKMFDEVLRKHVGQTAEKSRELKVKQVKGKKG